MIWVQILMGWVICVLVGEGSGSVIIGHWHWLLNFYLRVALTLCCLVISLRYISPLLYGGCTHFFFALISVGSIIFCFDST